MSRALVLAAALALGTGCASDCERFCGKLELCGIGLGEDRDLCLGLCEDEAAADADAVALCAQCVGDASCVEIDDGLCAGFCPADPG